MADAGSYWGVIETVAQQVNIYDGEKLFLASFAQVERPLGILYAAQFCRSEICNGGFDQFFYNGTGVLAPEAVEGFKAIGQTKIADLVAEAMAVLGAPYHRDRSARQIALENSSEEKLADLDRRFFSLVNTESGG